MPSLKVSIGFEFGQSLGTDTTLVVSISNWIHRWINNSIGQKYNYLFIFHIFLEK